MKKTLLIVAALFLVCGIAMPSYAGTPLLGKFCWIDNFGATWVLSASSFASENNDAHGYRNVSFTCNGTRIQPTTGTVVKNAQGNYVLGVWTAVNQPGACIGVSWHAVLNGTTLVSMVGGWRNQLDVEGAFSLAPVACPPVPVDNGESAPADANDPSLR